MRLSIIVTHYNEPWSICKEFFDSLVLQKGIDFSDIEVIIANDGDNKLPADAMDYPFEVKMVEHEHAGISATRNLGLDNAEGEYVMFCDCDDMFINAYGIHLLFTAINEKADVIMSTFLEEVKNSDRKFVPHDNDATFIHGKAFRKQYLIDENIRFKNELTIHEDGFFVMLAIRLTDEIKVISTPFYLWKWNDASTVRRDAEDYVLKTYDHLMNARTAMCRELNERGEIDAYIETVCKTVIDSYYDFNKPSYLESKNKPWREKAERAFKRFYEEFKTDYLEAGVARKAELMNHCRQLAYKNGFLVETYTIKDWLNHITKDV